MLEQSDSAASLLLGLPVPHRRGRDEAHAVGIYGERGSGLIEEMGVEDGVFVSINTAGKALGVAGAFVAGPAHVAPIVLASLHQLDVGRARAQLTG